MGAWGAGAFEDDAALDWLGGPFEERGEAAVTAALDDVLAVGAGQRVGYDTGAAGRAAAEVVAIAHGLPPAGLDDTVREDILTRAGGLRRMEGIAARATSALGRIWSDNSELNELWAEGEAGTGAEWNAALSDLTARLRRAEGG